MDCTEGVFFLLFTVVPLDVLRIWQMGKRMRLGTAVGMTNYSRADAINGFSAGLFLGRSINVKPSNRMTT